MANPGIKQTTVRLPEELHSRLADAARSLKSTHEELIKQSLEQELERLGFGKDMKPVRMLADPTDWSPQLAARFLQCVPAPFAIKDDQGRILWCNFAYLDALEMTMPQLIGKTITEIGSVSGKWYGIINGRIEVVLNSGNALEFLEPIVSRSGKTTIYQGQRFLFYNSKGHKLLGDISFDWAEIQAFDDYEHKALADDILTRFYGIYISSQIEDICQRFLEECSASVVIKDKDLKIVWNNKIYKDLISSNKANTETRGRTLKEVLPKAPDIDLIMDHDKQVLNKNIWMYTKERLKKDKPRTTLRFPIPLTGNDAKFIGAISTDFRLQSSGEAVL